ncbi:MAG: hypothetical protein Q8K83_06280 [Methylotenera sp.]|nr:hypothetical protein [Methylotenera sp.]
MLNVDICIGNAEDPYFNFVPDAIGKLGVVANDNEGKSFVSEIEVKSDNA